MAPSKAPGGGFPSRRKHPGRCCAAINCKNRSQTASVSFFRFPKDLERCKKWVRNTRREDLQKRNLQGLHQSHRLCADHFEDSQFMNPNQKNSLIHCAIPTLFDVPNPPPRITPSRPPPKPRPCPPVLSKHQRCYPSLSPSFSSEPDPTTPSPAEISCPASPDATNAVIELEHDYTNSPLASEAQKKRTEASKKNYLPPSSQKTLFALRLKLSNPAPPPLSKKENEVIASLRKKVLCLQKKVQRRDATIQRLRREKKSERKSATDNLERTLGQHVGGPCLQFILSQIRQYKMSANCWTNKDRHFAQLSVYHSSTKAYRLIRKYTLPPRADTSKGIVKNDSGSSMSIQ